MFVRSERFRWLAFLSMFVGGGALLYFMIVVVEYHVVMTPVYIATWIILTFAAGVYRRVDALDK